MKVGFIGAGKMAHALCRGFISAALVKPSDILASDINRGQLRMMRELGVRTTMSNHEVMETNEVVYLAVKPNYVVSVLKELSAAVKAHTLIVSIAAGVPTFVIEKQLPNEARVIRVMPNIAAVVQSSACVFARGKNADDGDCDLVTEMLNCVGLVEQMPEDLMDAATGLSGNGPAYGFVAIQALADGGVKMGLSRDKALRLAAQTMLGAAKMILEQNVHPEQLKDEVCSTGGTSIYALHRLEKAGFRGALMDAVEAGTLRSIEMGQHHIDNNK